MQLSVIKGAFAAALIAFAPAAFAQSLVTTSRIADGAVTTSKIADGAVTDAKIAGPISASKIDRTGLDADSLDGYQSGDFSPIMHNHVLSELQGLEVFRAKHTKEIVIADDGTGDFGGNVVQALAAATADPGTNYLVRILPGTYDLGSSPVDVGGNVMVWGSGAANTVLVGTTPGTADRGNACLNVGGELRDITVSCSPGGAYATAISLGGTLRDVRVTGYAASVHGVVSGSPTSLRNVTIDLSNDISTLAVGIYVAGLMAWPSVEGGTVTVRAGTAYGIQFDQNYRAPFNNFTVIRNARIFAESYEGTAHAIHANSGFAEIRGCRLDVAAPVAGAASVWTGGLSAVTVENSRISGATLITNVGGNKVRVAATRFQGTGAITGATCIGSFDEAFLPVTCP